MTLTNVAFFVKQVVDQDAQVASIKDAITTGIDTAQRALESSLKQQNIGLTAILKQNREAIDAATNQSKENTAEANRMTRESTADILAENHSAVELEQRAYVVFDAAGVFSPTGGLLSEIKADTPFRIQILLKNIARSPAFDKQGIVGAQFLMIPDRAASLDIGNVLMNAVQLERANPQGMSSPIREDMAPQQLTGWLRIVICLG
jgi:hypothetical protein